MIGDLLTAATPVGIALAAAALFVGVPLLLGEGIKRADEHETGWPTWLADLDVTDDGAATKRSPATEAATRQNLALVNSRPLAEAIVDELAQRRAGAR